MKRITYGAPRLVDWVAQIRAGAASIRVHFTGGALTSYGITPAEYTTENAFMQRVIEGSEYFRQGRIIRLSETTLADDEKKPRTKAAPKPKAESEQTPGSEDMIPGTDADNDEEPAGGEKSIEVSCLQDAQGYLQEHYGIATYKVRSYELAQQAAMEHGIRFSGGKFDE